MASLIDVGYVSPLNEDVLPSTGAHLDVRVRKSHDGSNAPQRV
jgi:hypothetical protein